MTEITFIVGSFRKGSFNHVLADAAMNVLKGKAEVKWLSFEDLPVFNYDQTYPFGEQAEMLRKTVSDAQALWIFCPEYNGSYPGVLKNLLDYLSLSNVENNYVSGTPLKGKPVTVSGCGGHFGASRAADALKVLLKNCGCKVMDTPDTQIKLPATAFSTGKWEPDEKDKELLEKQADAFLKFIQEN